MRYSGLELIDFTNYNNEVFQLVDFREIPSYNTLAKYDYKQNEFFDEIMSRPEWYGNGGEFISYSIIEANKIEMMDYKLDVSRIKSLTIPVVE